MYDKFYLEDSTCLVVFAFTASRLISFSLLWFHILKAKPLSFLSIYIFNLGDVVCPYYCLQAVCSLG